MDIYENRRILSCVFDLSLDVAIVEVYPGYEGYAVVLETGSSRVENTIFRIVRSWIRDKRVFVFWRKGVKEEKTNRRKERRRWSANQYLYLFVVTCDLRSLTRHFTSNDIL